MKIIDDITNIFKNNSDYKKINEINTIKMRNHKKGIQLNDALYYRFMYTNKYQTKENIVSNINYLNGTSFSRQTFDYKENHIPVKTYINIFHELRNLYNSNYNNSNGYKLIAIDGTYNNDAKMNEILNLGIYNVSNGIPIDIKSYGEENKNREIYSATDYIKNNIDVFKNNIIVVDRGYFSYKFLNFLNNNNLKFIVRVKGEGNNLNSFNELKPNVPNHNLILNIKKYTKIIKYDNILEKTIYSSNSKKKTTTHQLKIKNNCVIVTNLLNGYSDELILELYKSRWDIEVFFKYIKSNYKFQHTTESSTINHQKMYLCELIITYIAKIIEKYYLTEYPIKKNVNSKKGYVYKINKNNLIKGMFDSLIYNIINYKLTEFSLNKFCKVYIKFHQNKINRSYPRTSKTPFTKWYIKGYSNQTKYMSIIDAIINKKIDSLNKNLKTIAKRILSIDDINYN